MESSRSLSVSSVFLDPSPFLGYGILESLQGILDLAGEETPWGHEDNGLFVHVGNGALVLSLHIRTGPFIFWL